ncbi:MAG: hypothetical protein U1F66_08080 [bacterium]
MGDPIYKKFLITSGTNECLPPPPEASKDQCKIEVEEVDNSLTFTLERKGATYQVSSGDAAKVAKSYPSYNAPARELADFLLVKSEMFKNFGDKAAPSQIIDKVSIDFGGKDKLDAIFNWLNILANFISHGQLDPKHAKMKELQTTTIGISVYTFADPVLGVSVEKMLRGLKDNTKLAQGTRNRVDWLLGILSAREKFWGAMKPAMDMSQKLSDTLKARSVAVLTFLFANHILAEKGYNDLLFSQEIKDAAKSFHDVLSKVDSSYNASKNFYAFIRGTMSELRKANIPADYKSDFLQRVSFVETEFEKAARQEMIDILSNQPAEQSFKEYLQIKYGDTPDRAAALEIILKNMTLKQGSSATTYSFSMDKISKELQAWVELKTPDKRDGALQAILHLLKTLFERDGKMEIFLDKKIQESDNFYTTGNFSIISSNKKALEDLIVWARTAAKNEKVPVSPDDLPHVGLRKWTLGTELGLGLAGIGAGTAITFAPIQDKKAQYYSQGSAFILGGSALGAAGGNLLSYKLNVHKNAWLFDVGGAVVGGLIGGLIWGLAAKPPQPGYPGDPTRFPVDEYGP